MVQISTAIWAQSPAVTLANDLQGQSQQHLFSQNIRQKESIAFKKGNFRIVVLQPIFFRLCAFGQRSIEEIEGAVHVFDDRFEAARTGHFDLGLELAFDANLALQKFGRGGDFQSRDLLDLGRMEIDAARSVGLPDTQLSNGEFFYVEEQVWNASGANAHALSLFRRASSKSRNGAAF